MSKPPLEDHLHRLADQFPAPASPAARQAISQRAGVLRSRRQRRHAVGGGVLALVLVAGLVLLRRSHDPADVEVGPSNPAGEGSLPALTLDPDDGWEIVRISDTPDTPWVSADGPDTSFEGSLQVFRRPGELAGVTVVVEHTPASDLAVAQEGDETVVAGGGEGYLARTDATRFTLTWSPQHGDSQAVLRSFGLTRDQVVQFAGGLRLKNDTITFPAENDQFGFDATVLPDDIMEEQVGPLHEYADFRRLTLASGSAQVDITIDNRGDVAFEHALAVWLMSGGDVGQVSVLDHPALLLERGQSEWLLTWRDGDARVQVDLIGVDRATVDQVIESFQDLSEDDWHDLVARYG